MSEVIKHEVEVITAPDYKDCDPYKNVSVFLAGGISNCRDWQSDVIEELKSKSNRIIIFNPRREEFNSNEIRNVYEQITWEFNRIEQVDIFSIYFCNSESDQPICMYELGRNIVRMQCKYPNNWMDHIAVSIEEGYKRELDVKVQLRCCAPKLFINTDATPQTHAIVIHNCARRLSDTIY